MPCEKCGNPEAGLTPLCGVYQAVLCIPCRNAWERVARADFDWREILKINTLKKMAMQRNEKNEVERLEDTTRHHETQLYSTAFNWVEGFGSANDFSIRREWKVYDDLP